MAGFVDRRPNGRVLAGVIAGHAALLAALMLVRTEYERQKDPPMQVENIPIEPPPPPPPEPTPTLTPPTARSELTTVIPPRILAPSTGPVVPPSTPAPPAPFAPPGPTIFDPGPTVPLPSPPAPVPAPPPAPAPKPEPVALKPRGNPAGWVTNDDYPAAALRSEEQGRTGFRIEVGADGRPSACTVTASSGSRVLDDAACRLLMKRARFVPGKDADGRPAGGSWSNSFRWQIPEE